MSDDEFLSSEFDEMNNIFVENDEYCFCKSEQTNGLIECEGPECKIRLYHPVCVGLQVGGNDDEPSDWMCFSCLGQATPMFDKEPEECKEFSERPETEMPSGFTLENLQLNAKETVLKVFENLKFEPFCTLNVTFLQLICDVASNLKSNHAPCIDGLTRKLIEIIWPAISTSDNKKKQQSAKFEKKAMVFHTLRNSAALKSTCVELINSLGMKNEPLILIVAQFFFQRIVHEILQQKLAIINRKDCKKVKKLSFDEENALRYTAGYVCRKLYRHFGRHSKNEVAQTYFKILQEFDSGNCDINSPNLWTYTKKWINIVNRGGLFVINDHVYTFFYNMELVIRAHLTAIATSSDLRQKIENSEHVSICFNALMEEVDNDNIKQTIFNKFVSCWINLRLKAFSNIYMYIKKKEDAKLSKRSEKSMRRELQKENCS